MADSALAGAFADLQERLAKLTADVETMLAPNPGILNLPAKVHAVLEAVGELVGTMQDMATIVGALGHGLGELGDPTPVPVADMPAAAPDKAGRAGKRGGDAPIAGSEGSPAPADFKAGMSIPGAAGSAAP